MLDNLYTVIIMHMLSMFRQSLHCHYHMLSMLDILYTVKAMHAVAFSN